MPGDHHTEGALPEQEVRAAQGQRVLQAARDEAVHVQVPSLQGLAPDETGPGHVQPPAEPRRDWLSPEELSEFTGYSQTAAQMRFLRAEGYDFVLNGRQRLIVLRTSLDRRRKRGVNQLDDSQEPRWGAAKRRGQTSKEQ